MRLFVFLCAVYVSSVSMLSAKDDVTPVKKPEAGETNPDMQRISYAIGQQVGKSIKQQNIDDIDRDKFMKGFNTVLDGKKSELTEGEIQAAFKTLQQKMAKKQQALAERNKKEGENFLAENKNKKGVIETTSGLQYKIIKTLDPKAVKPKTTDTVEVHYEGKLLDGTVFDSSYKRGSPAKFAVNQVIPGWTEALTLMPVGSTWELYIPAKIAYGERAMASIPGNSTLIFKVELVNIEKKTASAEAAKKG